MRRRKTLSSTVCDLSTTMDKPPRLVSQPVGTILGIRNRIVDDGDIVALLGEEMVGEHFELLVELVASHLPKQLELAVVRKSLIDIGGSVLALQPGYGQHAGFSER